MNLIKIIQNQHLLHSVSKETVDADENMNYEDLDRAEGHELES